MSDPSSRWPEPMGYPMASYQPTQAQRPMPVNPAMRAATADRDRTVDVLKAAFAEGRLSQDEYNDRMSQAHTARTYGELMALTGDLPAGPVPLPMQPAWQMPVRSAQTNGMATAALVLGLLEFVTVGITAIPAIICGHVARSQIKRTGEQGDGMAVTGLVLGYGAVVFFVFMLVILAAISSRSGGAISGNPNGLSATLTLAKCNFPCPPHVYTL
jgi:uncharacterized membrane protein